MGRDKLRPANRLKGEKSPYLLQHARNPVDWNPWGEEAFNRATQEDKPIFLSIGYSTCHWCHVMEKECFEDEQVATALNRNFVPVKVDREERPDIDGIYMKVCQMLTGKGGWPLTVLLTPEKKPFFAGTYFPKHSRFGQPGLLDIIARIEHLWKHERNDLKQSGERITGALQETRETSSGKTPDISILHRAFKELSSHYDPEYGGFSRAPKFPTPHNLLFLLRYWLRTGQTYALEMAVSTLTSMRQGGIFDQIGGGFHRYSTDRQWFVPHFEKMLYDQALLSLAYIEAFQASGIPLFKRTAEDIFTYILRDMTGPEGGFYSAEDADSEGEEGLFYVWSWEEIHRILTPEEAALAVRSFSLTKDGNFTEEGTGKITGRNILFPGRAAQMEDETPATDVPVFEERLHRIRSKLMSARSSRVRPLRDDKILTDWNGLMIAALARGSRALNNTGYQAAAEKAADFLLSICRSEDGGLFHRFRKGNASIPAYVDDYAFLIWGLLEIYQTSYKTEYLFEARTIMDHLISFFWDGEKGGFFFTSEFAEKLLARPMEIYDGAVPSGNSVSLNNLLRLFSLTGEGRYAELASQMSARFFPRIETNPLAYTHFLSGLDFGFGPSSEVVICSPGPGRGTEEMLSSLHERYLPRTVTMVVSTKTGKRDIRLISPFTKDMNPVGDSATAYVCSGHSCRRPVTGIQEMLDLLKGDGYNSGIFKGEKQRDES